MRISKDSFAKYVNDIDRKGRYISVIITEVKSANYSAIHLDICAVYEARPLSFSVG